jgi:hypothetical protein
MPTFISKSQAARLKKAAKRYKKMKLLKPWNKRTDDELLRKVLGQVAVIGRAEPGERLQRDPRIARKLSVKKLDSFRSDVALQRYLHTQFAKLKIRFSLGSTWQRDWKAKACARNFRTLMAKGGPTQYFQHIANFKKEKERIAALDKELERYGDKSARDTPQGSPKSGHVGSAENRP